MAQGVKFKLFINPAGFIEQKFCGMQNAESVIQAVKKLISATKKLAEQKKSILILVDLTEIPRNNLSASMRPAHQEMLRAMKQEKYDRIAVYGNAGSQIVVNTLALIAGKRQKIRVFSNRIEALKWLKAPG